MKIPMRRTFRGFEPLEDGVLRHVKVGDVVECEISRPRSQQRHKWFWACMSVVHENLSERLALKYPTTESLVSAMKVLTGWADTYWLPDGREVVQPRSISFSSMDEDQFAAFCDRCMDLISRFLLPGINTNDLRREIGERTQERKAA